MRKIGMANRLLKGRFKLEQPNEFPPSFYHSPWTGATNCEDLTEDQGSERMTQDHFPWHSMLTHWDEFENND
jgi:hypothetical protein